MIKVSKNFEIELKHWLVFNKSSLILLSRHAEFSEEKRKWIDYPTFNDFNSFEMARILSEGYEVEMTAEEKALAYYNSFQENTGKLIIKRFLIEARIEFKGITDDDN